MKDIQTAQIQGIPALDGTYISEMDPWPMECPEFNRLYQFYDNLKESRFTTTKCNKCGNVAFPPGLICPACWSQDMIWIDLPRNAKVVTVTEVMAGAPKGFPSPLVLAWLDFGNDAPIKHLLVRVINCAEGELQDGDEVKFVVFDVPSHPIEVKKDVKVCERVYYAFEKVI
jgi:uncharacterized OB-fold protein